MYNSFFGLHKSPFNLTPDPNFLYLTDSHQEALAALSYAVFARKGIFVLSGDAGTGKTTLIMSTLRHLPPSQVQCSLIVNPTLTPAEFLEAVLLDFGFHDIPASKARRVAILQDFLWKAETEKQTAVLIVDEAHKLSLEVLEEIRLLGNCESTEEKLLQIVLLGQNELDQLLNSNQLRQFRQRIALRMQIEPLPAEEVGLYIQHRWTTAGGGDAPFSMLALSAIGQKTKGIPRLINSLCDNALMQSFADGSSTVEVRHVATACRDLHLSTSVSEIRDVAPPISVAGEDSHPVMALELNVLNRYVRMPAKRSMLGRLRSKLGLAQRIETA